MPKTASETPRTRLSWRREPLATVRLGHEKNRGYDLHRGALLLGIVRWADDKERREAGRGGGPWYFKIPSTGRNSLLAGARYRTVGSARGALMIHVLAENAAGRLLR